LTAGEELRLFQLMDRGDEAARERLITANLSLVRSFARRFARTQSELPDLVQDGTVGLIRALERFDWRRGNRFSTYAVFWIRQAMMRSPQSAIRVPEGRVQQTRLLRRAKLELRSALGREPLERELAAFTGLTEATVRQGDQVSPAVLSLDEPLSRENEELSLHDLLPDTVDIWQDVEENERSDVVRDALTSLPDRERDVVVLRYGLGDGGPKSLAETGEQLGFSRHRASRLEANGLRRLSRDERLRALVGDIPRRLRALLPFDLAGAVAALRASLSTNLGAKVGASVAVVVSAAAVSHWQGVGPFQGEDPPPAGKERAAAPNDRAHAAVAAGRPAPLPASWLSIPARPARAVPTLQEEPPRRPRPPSTASPGPTEATSPKAIVTPASAGSAPASSGTQDASSAPDQPHKKHPAAEAPTGPSTPLSVPTPADLLSEVAEGATAVAGGATAAVGNAVQPLEEPALPPTPELPPATLPPVEIPDVSAPGSPAPLPNIDAPFGSDPTP
jgi:RNA polymerase primary sigma factor